MSKSSKALTQVLAQIDAAGMETRYLYHSELIRAISDIEDAGGSVPQTVKHLAEDILAEVIEARFDNMPV